MSDKRHIFLDPLDLFSCNQPYEFRRIIFQSPNVVVKGSHMLLVRAEATKESHPVVKNQLICFLKSIIFLFIFMLPIYILDSLLYNGMFFSHTCRFLIVFDL